MADNTTDVTEEVQEASQTEEKRPAKKTATRARKPKADAGDDAAASKPARKPRASKAKPKADADPNAPKPEMIDLNKIKITRVSELAQMAKDLGVESASSLRKQDLIFALLKRQAKAGGVIYGEGVLETLPDGFGFLRAPDYNYLPGPDDIYVSPSQIRRFNLRTGDTVAGQIRPPKDSERYFALLKVEKVNSEAADQEKLKTIFENLTPLYAMERFKLEYKPKTYSTRIIEMLAPIGKGQRAIIVAPPRTGKTVLMQQIAAATKKKSSRGQTNCTSY